MDAIMDRAKQVEWLNLEAEDILLLDMSGGQGQIRAADLVSEWVVQQQLNDGDGLPWWFDSHDIALLITLVDKKMRG